MKITRLPHLQGHIKQFHCKYVTGNINCILLQILSLGAIHVIMFLIHSQPSALQKPEKLQDFVQDLRKP